MLDQHEGPRKSVRMSELEAVVMAEVKQGNMPIIGAKVKAERPQLSGEISPSFGNRVDG